MLPHLEHFVIAQLPFPEDCNNTFASDFFFFAVQVSLSDLQYVAHECNHMK